MKKIAIVSAVSALTLASMSAAQAAPQIYGKAFVTVDYTDTNYDDSKKKDDSTFKLNSNASRIGFKGDEELTTGTDLIYQLEYEVNIDDGNKGQFTSRNTYLGLANKQYGTLLAGRHDTPFKLVQNKVDVFNDTVLDMKEAGVSGENRANNVLAYQSPAIVGIPLTFMGAISLSETDEDGDVLVRAASGTTPAVYRDRQVKDNAYSASLAYDQNGIYLGGAYDNGVGAVEDAWRLVGGLDMGKLNMMQGLTLGALYQQSDYYDTYTLANNVRQKRSSETEKSWLVSGKYKIANSPWAVKAQYVNTTDEKGVKNADADEIAVGGEYTFNKATTGHIYAGQISRDNNKDDTIVGTGIEYKF